MDDNAYLVEQLVHGRLTELRKAAAHHALVTAARPARPSWRDVLGRTLIRAGMRIATTHVESAPA
jgi:hypothetical protein